MRWGAEAQKIILNWQSSTGSLIFEQLASDNVVVSCRYVMFCIWKRPESWRERWTKVGSICYSPLSCFLLTFWSSDRKYHLCCAATIMRLDYCYRFSSTPFTMWTGTVRDWMPTTKPTVGCSSLDSDAMSGRWQMAQMIHLSLSQTTSLYHHFCRSSPISPKHWCAIAMGAVQHQDIKHFRPSQALTLFNTSW